MTSRRTFLLAAVGGMLGQDFGGYLAFSGDFVVVPAFTDWSTLVPSLTELFEAGVNDFSTGAQSLFAGEIADGLFHTFAAVNSMFVLLPAMVFLAVPVLAATVRWRSSGSKGPAITGPQQGSPAPGRGHDPSRGPTSSTFARRLLRFRRPN